MTNNDSVLKGIFIRALTEARMRNPGTALAQYIDAYIHVQVSLLILTLNRIQGNDTGNSTIPSWPMLVHREVTTTQHPGLALRRSFHTSDISRSPG